MAEDRDQLARDLRALADDAEALLQHVVRDAGAGYAEARERLQQRLHDVRDQLAGLNAAAMDSARRAGRAADDYVHENPWTAIGAGAGLGLLLGMLIARR
jgi:ElaB/YqjD/DUF883 family membrane-anchored ribosome-binding protein